MKLFYSIILILIFDLLLINSINIFSYEWNKGIRIFQPNMTILEVEKSLEKIFPHFQKAKKYESINRYFKAQLIENQLDYFENNRNIQLDQSVNNAQSHIRLTIKLKKVFGYKFGNIKALNGNQLYEQKNQFESIESKLQQKKNNTYYPKIIYNYAFYPIKKINPLLQSIELSFYEERLFKMVYFINLNSKQLKYFENHISNNYKIIKKNNINFYKKNHIKLRYELSLSYPKKNIFRYHLEYTYSPLEKKYLKYMKKMKIKVNTILLHEPYKTIKEF